MLAYILVGAAEVDLANYHLEPATTRAEAALHTAQMINQPCEIALARSILIQTALNLGELDRATVQWQALQTQVDRHTLSTRARIAMERSVKQFNLSSDYSE
jgi:hypothetical protein